MRAMTGGSAARNRDATKSGDSTFKATRGLGSVSPGRLPPPTVERPGTTSAATPSARSLRARFLARLLRLAWLWPIIRHTGTLSMASPSR